MRQMITRILCLGIALFAQVLPSKLTATDENRNSPRGRLPSFPGAEGYGSSTIGGRGGKVYIVGNLNESGPGSLREAIEAEGPRIVVFEVSGTIEGDFSIRNDFVTIAGQTAPGDGICIKGSLGINASEVILRYLRVRPNSSGGVDAISGRGHRNIILDHLSASWSSDEVLSLYRNENLTVQWCLLSEGCVKVVNGKDTGHRFGGIWGNQYGTYHHNLFAHNDSRNPRWAPGGRFNDYRNNVIYNWGYNSCYGGGATDRGDPNSNFFTVNMVANYYKPGPATVENVKRRIAAPNDSEGVGSWYVADNVVEGFPAVTSNNWLGIDGTKFDKLDRAWEAMPIRQEPARAAFQSVLEEVGCSLPSRDSVDRRIIREVRRGTAEFGIDGMIATPADVGGWPFLKGEPPLADRDRDGMPDEWESKHQLDPVDPSDNIKDSDGDGYTNLEEYLNATDPKARVDYTQVENNVCRIRAESSAHRITKP